MNSIRNSHKGVVALIAVIILGAVIAAIALSIVVIGISSRSNAFHTLQTEQVFIKTDGCTEEALIQLNRDNAYVGDTYTIDEASCTVSVTGIDPNRTVTISTTEGDYTHDFTIDVQLTPTFAILNFSE